MERIVDVGCNYLHHKKRQETERIELTPWFYYDIIKTKKRIINAPSAELKKVQRTILRKYFKDHFRFNSVKYGRKGLVIIDSKENIFTPDKFTPFTEKGNVSIMIIRE